jgi:hypothetical protein
MFKFFHNFWRYMFDVSYPPVPEPKFKLHDKVVTPYGDQIMIIRSFSRNQYCPYWYDCVWFDKFGKLNCTNIREDELTLSDLSS